VLNSRHQQGSGLGWASLLSLDRLMISNPEAFGRQMLASDKLNVLPGGTRAQLLARLDPRYEVQLTQIKEYLGRTDVPAEEFKRFMEIFPNHNLAVAPALVTPLRTSFRSLQDGALVDLAALKAVERWVGGGGLSASARQHINVLQKRLQLCREVIDGAVARGEFRLQ